jgi:hypothetical protein
MDFFINQRIAKFVDKEHESLLNQLENTFTSIYFLVEYVLNFFKKYINKIKKQNSLVTKMGIDLKELPWFENLEGNLVFNSSIELKTVHASNQVSLFNSRLRMKMIKIHKIS